MVLPSSMWSLRTAVASCVDCRSPKVTLLINLFRACSSACVNSTSIVVPLSNKAVLTGSANRGALGYSLYGSYERGLSIVGKVEVEPSPVGVKRVELFFYLVAQIFPSYVEITCYRVD